MTFIVCYSFKKKKKKNKQNAAPVNQNAKNVTLKEELKPCIHFPYLSIKIWKYNKQKFILFFKKIKKTLKTAFSKCFLENSINKLQQKVYCIQEEVKKKMKNKDSFAIKNCFIKLYLLKNTC